MKRNDTRPLTVNGQPWEYKIGRNTGITEKITKV